MKTSTGAQLQFGSFAAQTKYATSLTMASYHLIGCSISNSMTLYGLAPLYITNWHVLNESIQTLLTETGTPCHSPHIHKKSSGRRVSPCRAPSLWTRLPVHFREISHWVSVFKAKHEAHLIG